MALLASNRSASSSPTYNPSSLRVCGEGETYCGPCRQLVSAGNRPVEAFESGVQWRALESEAVGVERGYAPLIGRDWKQHIEPHPAVGLKVARPQCRYVMLPVSGGPQRHGNAKETHGTPPRLALRSRRRPPGGPYMNHAVFTKLMLRHMPASPASRTFMLPSYADSCVIHDTRYGTR